MAQEAKLNLPWITRVKLENFDLYTRQPNVDVVIDRPVFCLMGANGLGKSTFLNALNFVITGAIPDPARKFHSAQDYQKDVTRTDRRENYFGGRISERNRDLVSVTVQLTWPSAIIAVTRELFGTTGISRIEVNEGELDPEIYDARDQLENLEGVFQRAILRLTGLADFSQFVFIMHFIATFDEGRHLLMWDDSALTNALYLAFGADPGVAKRTSSLKRDLDRESSRGRNLRFSARHVTERINQLVEILNDNSNSVQSSDQELTAQFEHLTQVLTDAHSTVQRRQLQLKDADLKWVDLSAAVSDAQSEYRRLFSGRLTGSSRVDTHPLVRATLAEGTCALCGTVHVGAAIQSKLDASCCPLCDTTLDKSTGDDETINHLKAVDGRINVLRQDLSQIIAIRERVNAELAAALATEDAAKEALDRFQSAQDLPFTTDSDRSFKGIETEIEKLRVERKGFEDQSKAHYKKRDDIRNELREYEKKLRQQYDNVAELFVPRFRELAEDFIGLPIDVELVHRQGANDAGFGLSLRMGEQLRPHWETVSESQRFFIDIALRMALAEFMTAGPATLLIDTPEGSLDIAYEARAGSMFAKFAQENHIIMTANLRSSELVDRLAHLQKRAGMQVVRMTDWTDLSEVQQAEESLFLSAFDKIDSALD